MKVNVVTSHVQRPVASNYSAKEFLAEAHNRFPQPSEFLAAFLQRFEQLVELDEAVERHHFQESKSEQINCPACGSDITLELETELDKLR